MYCVLFGCMSVGYSCKTQAVGSIAVTIYYAAAAAELLDLKCKADTINMMESEFPIYGVGTTIITELCSNMCS